MIEQRGRMEIISLHRMPPTETDLWVLVSSSADVLEVDTLGGAFAVIEQVSGYIGNSQPGSAMFKFGQSYGTLRMALTAAYIPFDEVRPATWQKAMGVAPRKKLKAKRGTKEKLAEFLNSDKSDDPTRGAESKRQFKTRLKQKAQQLFPGTVVTLETADALLLAEYCRRLKTGRLQK